MSANVLLTGGAGYLGSVLAPALLDRGFHVTVLDNFSFQQDSLLACCANSRFSVIRGDARDAEALKRGLRHADIVIPLAALVGAPACQADQTNARSLNLDAIKLLMSLRSPRQRVIYPTTNSGYGIGEKGSIAPRTAHCGDLAVRRDQRCRPRPRCWSPAIPSRSDWRRCLACRRGCASTCWLVISCTAQ